ncbi:MAG: pyridoxamine 5'-phosphate oxidase family protein [Rubrobacteraceae bacterium]
MTVYDTQTLRTAAEAAAVAELAYTGPDGVPRIEALTPLLLNKEPVFALPYARTDLARCLENDPRVSLTFSDSRLARVGWSPLTVEGSMEVTPDPEGDLFLEEPLYWELRKFWPSRQLIGSLVLRRDNWWYVSRLILSLTEIGTPKPITRRTDPDQGILAWKEAGTISSTTVRVDDWDSNRPLVSPISQEPLPDNAPSTLLYHDFSVPDREQTASLNLTGTLNNGRLSVTHREGSRTLEKRPGLISRWRAQKDLERHCKSGLKTRES